MPTTLTLKNIPDAVYERLKVAAARHRRSMNSEAIVWVESVLLPDQTPTSERLTRARELRASQPQHCLLADDIGAVKKAGSPMIVVDTNILAYLHLPYEFSGAAETLLTQ